MKKLTVVFLCCMLLLCACGEKSYIRLPMDADVSFTPTVYYGEDGAISFLYDKDRDMLSTVYGYGQSMVALYDGGDYSLVISYEETQKTRKEADAEIAAEFVGMISLSETSKSVTVSGYPFRYADIAAEDGSRGGVWYGNTANGYAKMYYIVSADAKEGTQAHVEEILSTVVFGLHDEADTEENVNIYVQ